MFQEMNMEIFYTTASFGDIKFFSMVFLGEAISKESHRNINVYHE